MIRLVDICKAYNDKVVLDNINLEIADGETLAIIGGSGSGKSTLLRLMIGLIKPTSGQIWLGNDDIAAMNEKELDNIRLHMGMVFQYSALFDSMSVGDNVAFGLREHTDYDEEKIMNIVREKLDLVGLPGTESMMPDELSGGMKKRLQLATVLLSNPRVLLLDEPLLALDMVAREDILKYIISYKMSGGMVIIASHDESVFSIADKTLYIDDNKCVTLSPGTDLKQLLRRSSL